MLLFCGGLARPDDRLRRHIAREGKFPGGVARLAGGRTRSRALYHVHPVARAGARRVTPAVLHDHTAGVAGARAHLQGAEGEYYRQGSRHLRFSWLPGFAGGRHSYLQG